MRDHPAHGIEILGSGWGVRLGPQRSGVRRVFREAWRTASHDTMFWAARKAYGPDQVRWVISSSTQSIILSVPGILEEIHLALGKVDSRLP